MLTVIFYDYNGTEVSRKEQSITLADYVTYIEPFTNLEKTAIFKNYTSDEVGKTFDQIRDTDVIFKTTTSEFKDSMRSFNAP
ncbi:hypothetical protein HZB01_04045 [Candidatus Woesearchaeota archaeon]|nr:hypothetical protein [Candidatus Woesearchaeota archaeon]